MRLVIVVSLEDLIHTTFTISGKSMNNKRHQLLQPIMHRWKPFDPARNVPDLGPRFSAGEKIAYATLRREKIEAALLAQQTLLAAGKSATGAGDILEDEAEDDIVEESDKADLDWSTVIKRTFEAYIRGERPNMYGEWLVW